jgi:antitoxin (DNA-binding transcriptional repressor) of toxin-antitoxin stability system
MTTVTIEEAQAKLQEIIQHLNPGEEITILDHGEPLAQVKRAESVAFPHRWRCHSTYRTPLLRAFSSFL